MYTALLFHSRCVRHTRFTKVKERVSPRRLSSLPSVRPSVLLPGLQYRRRSITSGVDRSRRRRQRGRAQNPLGNQSSTALLSLSRPGRGTSAASVHVRSSVRRWWVAAQREQELVKKRKKRIRTRFDAAAERDAEEKM